MDMYTRRIIGFRVQAAGVDGPVANLMGTIADIHKILVGLIERAKDRKAAAELREIQRMIATFQSEQAALHEQNLKLMTENADLKSKNAALEKRMAQADEKSRELAADSAQFVEHRGALFKKKLDGGYHSAVYCPRCKISMGSLPDIGFFCGKCQHSTGFGQHELAWIIAELQRSKRL